MEPTSPRPDFSHLRGALSGALHEPGELLYAQLATPWNVAVTTSPAAVVGATTAQDVVEAVNFAAANGLAVAVRATGHGIASNLDGALLIHTDTLNECVINESEGGGIGPMARTFGAASDMVRSFDVVTGDGALRHVTAATETELF